jgi:hypothetical protein
MSVYYLKYLKYKNKYLELKNMYGGSFENNIKNIGIVIIKGTESGSHTIEISKDLKEFIYDKLEKFIKSNHDIQLAVDDLYNYFDSCFKKILAKNKDGIELIYENSKGLNTKETVIDETGKEIPLNLWMAINGSKFELAGRGKIWIVIDKYFIQFMFFTITGVMRFTIFPDPKKINFNYEYQIDNSDRPPEVPSDADIYIRFEEIDFTSLRKKTIKQIVTEELYMDYESMKKIAEFMYKYQKRKNTRFITILGKASFWVESTCAKCELKNDTVKKISHVKCPITKITRHIYYEPENKSAAQMAYLYTKELLSNLLFRECNLGIIICGYGGVIASECGITRTVYELAKYYEKPVISITCNAGLFDKNAHSDVIGYYGMHWGEDTKALSSYVDGAIMIAPFGAWSQLELFYLLNKEKPTAIFLPKDYISYIINQIKHSDKINPLQFHQSNKTPLNDIFYQKIYNDTSGLTPIETIADKLISELGLGKADKFGLEIIFSALAYNSESSTIECIMEMKEKCKKINPEPLTLWYPHYNKDINGIPVYIDYGLASKYLLEQITPELIQNKLEQFEEFISPKLKSDSKYTLNLNRQWETPFNPLTGSYNTFSYERELLSDEF